MIMELEASGANLTSDAVKAKILQNVKLEREPLNSNDDEALYTINTNSNKLTNSNHMLRQGVLQL